MRARLIGSGIGSRLPSRRFALTIAGAAALAAVSAAAALALPGSQAAAKKGGTITVVSAGDVDHIDPGTTYYSFGYEIAYATQRPLYSYRPNSVAPLPDLAALELLPSPPKHFHAEPFAKAG